MVLEIQNLIVYCAASFNVMEVFPAFSTLNGVQIKNKGNNCANYVFNQQAILNFAVTLVKYKHRLKRCTISDTWDLMGCRSANR